MARPIALLAARRYIRVNNLARAETIMRAEIERLTEEIKQSVGLLRRHL